MSAVDNSLRTQFEEQYEPTQPEPEEQEAVVISCGSASC